MLGAFFDDSGTHEGSPVVAMGGLLGTDRAWDVFVDRWTELLKSPLPDKPPLRQFHTAPCRNGAGEFASYSQAERDHATYLFRRVILEGDLVTVASVVDKHAWDELVTGAVAEQVEGPLNYSFFKCIETVMDIIRVRCPGERITFFFDEGTRPRIGEFAQYVEVRKDQYPEIDRILFVPVKEVIPMQGADMMAYQSYLFGQAWLKQGKDTVADPHFRDFVGRELSVGLIMMREHIEEMVGRVRETLDGDIR
jgi:uncharacterized protein DUF3800